MVKTGQGGRKAASRPEIVPVVYRNARRPGSELEVMRLSQIVRRAPPGQMERVQRMEFHLLAFFLSGRCTHVIDFEPHRCRPGTVVHVQPGQVQRWNLTPGLEAEVLVFTPTFLFPSRPRAGAPPHERFLDDPAWPAALDLDGPAREATAEWFTRLGSIYAETDDSPIATALLRHLVSVLVLDLARRCRIGLAPVAARSAERERLRQFRLDVERSFRVTRRVLDYAERLECSAKTLDRACREVLGTSAKAHLDARVVLEAKRMLAHTDASVAAIGEELGFSEPTNFVKFFKARAGKLPGAFREEQASRR